MAQPPLLKSGGDWGRFRHFNKSLSATRVFACVFVRNATFTIGITLNQVYPVFRRFKLTSLLICAELTL